jgi:Predicted periplasmic or secreted lipoprotein
MNRHFSILAVTLGLALTPGLALADSGDHHPDALQKASNYLTDSAITGKLKTELLTQKGLESGNIHVETSDGVVTLSGSVPTEAQSALAEDVVKHTDGVKDVHNALHVTHKK